MRLMDSYPVSLDQSLPSAAKMPNSVDIGLNFIKRREKKLVPTLVRLPMDEEYLENLFRDFKRL